MTRFEKSTIDMVFGNCWPNIGNTLAGQAIWVWEDPVIPRLPAKKTSILDDEAIKALTAWCSSQVCSPGSMPRLDVSFNKEKQEYLIEAAIAGYSKDEVEVTVEGDRIIFSHTKSKSDNEGCAYLMGEISRGSFNRWVRLPETADFDRITSSYADGVISIVVPIKESKKPKKLSF